MVGQGFHIGERDWYVMCYYDILTRADLAEAEGALISSGCPPSDAAEAASLLATANTGYTFTNYHARLTIVLVARATSPAQTYDTIQHELKHATEHISDYFGLDGSSEEAAYLQGELARRMYPAASVVVCPRCNGG